MHPESLAFHEVTGRFFIGSFLREEMTPYPATLFERWMQHRERASDSSAPRSSAAPTWDLTGLGEAERYRAYLGASTAFHEGLHFHQVIGTTTGRALFELTHQVFQKCLALWLVQNGHSTTLVWPAVPSLPKHVLLSEIAQLSLIARALDANESPQEREHAKGGMSFLGIVTGGSPQLELPAVHFENKLFPLGARMIMEGWAASLTQIVMYLNGGQAAAERYGAEKQKGLWHYWLLSELVGRAIWKQPPAPALALHTAVSRIAFFSMQIGHPMGTDEQLIRPGFFENRWNHPGFRLGAALLAFGAEPALSREPSEVGESIDRVLTTICRKHGLEDPYKATQRSGTELLDEARRVAVTLGVKLPGDAFILWGFDTFARSQVRIGEQLAQYRGSFFDIERWLSMCRTFQSPGPHLNLISVSSEGGRQLRYLRPNHLLSPVDAFQSVRLFVLHQLLNAALTTGRIPDVCPLAAAKIQFKCDASQNPCAGEYAYDGPCPFRWTSQVLRGELTG